jgi:hypothetical protein
MAKGVRFAQGNNALRCRESRRAADAARLCDGRQVPFAMADPGSMGRSRISMRTCFTSFTQGIRAVIESLESP